MTEKTSQVDPPKCLCPDTSRRLSACILHTHIHTSIPSTYILAKSAQGRAQKDASCIPGNNMHTHTPIPTTSGVSSFWTDSNIKNLVHPLGSHRNIPGIYVEYLNYLRHANHPPPPGAEPSSVIIPKRALSWKKRATNIRWKGIRGREKKIRIRGISACIIWWHGMWACRSQHAPPLEMGMGARII